MKMKFNKYMRCTKLLALKFLTRPTYKHYDLCHYLIKINLFVLFLVHQTR
jgi:hypothetical protein